jgi:hypothetical protein
MTLDSQTRDSLLEQMPSEGAHRFVFPGEAAPAGVQVPAQWRELFAQPEPHKLVVDALWSGVQELLPLTVAALSKGLSGLALLVTEAQPPSILYLLGSGDALRVRRGFPGIAALPDVARDFDAQLAPFYRMHDGWVTLASADLGPLPSRAWMRMGTDPNGAGGFLGVFSHGSSVLGFELETRPPAAFALFPNDDEVEPVENFWSELDGWMAPHLKAGS